MITEYKTIPFNTALMSGTTIRGMILYGNSYDLDEDTIKELYVVFDELNKDCIPLVLGANVLIPVLPPYYHLHESLKR